MLVPGSQREGVPGPGRLPPYPLPSLRRQDPRPSPELERNLRLFQLRGLPPRFHLRAVERSGCHLQQSPKGDPPHPGRTPHKHAQRRGRAFLSSQTRARSGGEGAAPAPGLGLLPPSSPQLPPAARAARSWQGPASQTPARCPPGPGTRSSPRAPGLGGESGAAPTPSPRPAAPVQHRDGGQRPDGGAAEPGSREEGES